MAVAEIRPDWTIGALNLTSGSTAFTTTGSMLQTAAIQPGDELITRSGLVLIIASITGQNSGTLMQPCPAGAAGTGQPLRVRFQPDGSRYNGAAAELVQLLSGGNTYAIAGLDGTGGNKGVMLTGAGTASTYALTELGRALLALTGTNGNIPVMTGSGAVASRPIVGTVSQSGGVPTGGIVQSGTNANGTFVRLSDGTQFCWRSALSIPFATSSILQGFWNFPAAFISAAVVNLTPGTFSTISSSGSVREMSVLNQSAGTCLARANGTGFVAADTLAIDCFASGRWFA